MTRLRFDKATDSKYQGDLARMLKVLEDAGYTADPGDVMAAYTAWSLKVSSMPWHHVGYLNDEKLLAALKSVMTEVPPPPAAEPKPAKHQHSLQAAPVGAKAHG